MVRDPEHLPCGAFAVGVRQQDRQPVTGPIGPLDLRQDVPVQLVRQPYRAGLIRQDAHRLVRLIEGIPAKINLIPFNEWPGAPYTRSSNNRIHAFADIVHKAGYASPIRTPRGEDIMAACGQLKSATERGRKSRAEIAAETA